MYGCHIGIPFGDPIQIFLSGISSNLLFGMTHVFSFKEVGIWKEIEVSLTLFKHQIFYMHVIFFENDRSVIKNLKEDVPNQLSDQIFTFDPSRLNSCLFSRNLFLPWVNIFPLVEPIPKFYHLALSICILIFLPKKATEFSLLKPKFARE